MRDGIERGRYLRLINSFSAFFESLGDVIVAWWSRRGSEGGGGEGGEEGLRVVGCGQWNEWCMSDSDYDGDGKRKGAESHAAWS